MSGIVCILQLDGAPLEPTLLGELTAFLRFRGPDGYQTWARGPVGLGHTMLRTGADAEAERQPACLDDHFWVAADARIDGRDELIEELQESGRSCSKASTDPELILHAYRAWQDACVDHLIGDFAFIIWDDVRRRLFCARDQMGVKPFYYAHLGSTVILSNTLHCIRLHPAVSDRLNDLAVSDFLLFDFNQDPGTTSFVDIQRLAPAHVLTCEQGRLSLSRYWELPIPAPIYRPGQECVDQFRELLDRAVSDRLRTSAAGVLMSGGLDSSTVAASAQRALARRGHVGGLIAQTRVLDGLIPHEERHYAQLVAAALHIPIEFETDHHRGIFDGLGPDNQYPEPIHSAWLNPVADQLSRIADRSRVVLTGYGADPVLTARITVHFRRLLKERKWRRALSDARLYWGAERRLSRLYLRRRLRLLQSSWRPVVSCPEWLNKDLEARFDLRSRWESLTQPAAPIGAVRPVAYESVLDPMWQNIFENNDPGITRTPVEIRNPFLDLRLMNFLLALPTLPWCADKELLRVAARGVLPDAVRLRRKSPLLADPLVTLLQRQESEWVDRFVPADGLDRYVVRDRIPAVFREKDPARAHVNLRPLSLNFWLRTLAS